MTSPCQENKKKVRFMDPISTVEEPVEELAEEENSDPWPNAAVNEFDAIMAHKLKIQIKKIDSDDDDDSEEQGQWPLFGDSVKTIMPSDDESDDQQLLSSQEVNKLTPRLQNVIMCRQGSEICTNWI